MRGLDKIALALVSVAALACQSKRNDTLTDSAFGEIAPDSALEGVVFRGVKVPLTSDNFRKFVVAQQRLDSVPEPVNTPRVDLRDPTDADIERTVNFLENDRAARRAIESADLSVKDFVLTSIALGQALAFSGQARAVVPAENIVFIDRNRDEAVRVRDGRRFRVFIVDDDDDDDDARRELRRRDRGNDDDDNDDERRGRGRGRREDDDRENRGRRGDDHGGRGRH